MDWFNHVIVGSGPAGVAAARQLENNDTCIIDIGDLPREEFPFNSLAKGLIEGDPRILLGSDWEMLANLVRPDSTHPKLRARGTRYVANGRTMRFFDASGQLSLLAAGSHAAGGMSNAWGGQLLRYTDADLSDAGNWPIDAALLRPYYDDLENYIGIAGLADDMHAFLGDTQKMLPPTPLGHAANLLLARYARRRGEKFPLCLGRSRLALLTRPHDGNIPYQFGETEFFATGQSGLYSARRTLNELRDRGHMNYIDGHELLTFRELPEYVEIELNEVATNSRRIVRAGHLLLGCGAPQTARLLLLNRGGQGVSLPFIDHPPTLLPIFMPTLFGASLPQQSVPIQLVATLLGAGSRDMISFYYPGGLLWSDLLGEIPLPVDAAIKVLPDLLGGMLVAQIWGPSRAHANNRLSVDADGSIRIDYRAPAPFTRLPELIRTLRSLGAYSMARLSNMSSPGWGFHYAGCLPMKSDPQPFETHIDGRLWDSRRVRAIDGSVLPSLPAKNHSLTLMANAARIADEIRQCGY